jgi:penicillin-binding protein 2
MNKTVFKRVRVFSAITVLVILALTARLAWLQVYQYDHYLSRAENNRQRELPITAPRGEIFAAGGELLVANRPGFTVSLLDLNLREAEEVIRYLSDVLELEEDEIRTKIKKQQFRSFAPIRIANNVSPDVVAKLEERRLELPGVIIETQPVRDYVSGSLAAHVLGYVRAISPEQIEQMQNQGYYYRGTDEIGQSGVEASWEQMLRGEEGTLLVETNRYGRRTRVLSKEEPTAGNSLTLTLDLRLQEITERALAEMIKGLVAKGVTDAGRGAVVILDPNSGAIRAMASYPAYDLNKFSSIYQELNADKKNQPLRNKAIQEHYPVGSTFKMLPGIAALEEGLITEKSTVTCRGAATFFRTATRKCLNVHGTVSIVPALAKSCNIFFYEMGYRLGTDLLTTYSEKFGFGSTTGLKDVIGEVAGLINGKKYRPKFQPGDVLSAAIGQGHNITPLQMANYAAMLANRGTHYRPYLVQQAVDSKGKIVFEAEPEVINQLNFSDKNWDIIQNGMKAVTEGGGTASFSMSRLPVKVAGKTGTAQAPPKLPHSTFVGYAPADNPELAFFIIVENSVEKTGTATPVMARILREYYTPEPIPEPAENAQR